MNAEERDKAVDEVTRVTAAIKPLLAGHSPEVQAMVLSDLVAIFLAGWSPKMRKEMLAAHIDHVRSLIHINEMLIFGEEGHPDRGMKQQ
ncbi:hypothetical protein GOC19_32155 [Sinorhizobium meliloti]|uniref:hypothetical protein n=1 Tax=Rhizobium meliloti TaxID=382 RepID=UPI000FD35B68|nr:hypothetical protein [Sinorhizobium meliloti]MDW9825238.1 hypothetical protein [Sinorhizobium meliloti]MDW9868772.1 hypothetical protein [Sinorhizobium meliloti]MDX0060972.1 hypothetical protein [Sinorhizobium meliloti]RVG48990.1 hypothetical protein CN224_30375 [Sinorhizobium meliloti]RVL75732.1 hypothetical protein CN135_24575 [Sinorhizobium meliloti]